MLFIVASRSEADGNFLPQETLEYISPPQLHGLLCVQCMTHVLRVPADRRWAHIEQAFLPQRRRSCRSRSAPAEFQPVLGRAVRGERSRLHR